MAGSGIDPETGAWSPAFPGQRPPLEPGHEHRVGEGNELAVRHAAYADVKLGPRVAELADGIRELVPSYRPADEIALRLLCLAVARLERTAEAIGDATKPDELARLRQDERGWSNTARRYLNDLGMTPMARSKLRLDVAMTTRVLTLTGLVEDAQQAKDELEEPSS